MAENQHRIKGINCTLQLDITGEDGGNWNLKIVDGQGTISEGTAEGADLTFSIETAVWIKIATGDLHPQVGFMNGNYEISGDRSFTSVLEKIFGYITADEVLNK